MCSPLKDSETHFNYGIGILLDVDTDQRELEQVFKEFSPQTGYIQTDDTDYEIYFENGESGLFCELWVPVKKN